MPDEPHQAGAVIDASALSAVIFGEPGAERIAQEISRYAWAVTTSLLEFEVRNVGLVKARRGEISFDEAKQALRAAGYPLTRPFDFDEAFQLAANLDLTLYDAAYLQLAKELEVALLTLDTQLLQAAPERCVAP